MHFEKNISHVHLLDAIEESKICPICELIVKNVEKYIDDLLYENVNSPAIRTKLEESKGFCSLHADLIMKHGDALGIAILYSDQMNFIIKRLKKENSILASAISGDKKDSEYFDHKNCPVCKIKEDAEKRFVSVLNELLEEDENTVILLEKSHGLCCKHLLMTLAQIHNNEKKKQIIAFHLRLYDEVLSDLKEFIRKNDYRFKDENFGRESDSWKKALLIVSGKST